MEEQIEKFGSGRKQKRLNNKRQRGQMKNMLRSFDAKTIQDDQDDDFDELDEELEWRIAS